MRLRKHRGFSLLEMMIVVAIGMTMATVAIMTLMPLFNKNHVDQAYDTTLSVLRTYRNLAITQSNRYIIVPTAPGTITVQFWGYIPPPGVSPAPVTVATLTLPPDVQFLVQSGSFPNPGPDTIGAGTLPIFTEIATTGVANTCSVVEGGVPCLVFYPDGSAQDDAGNYTNGIFYMMRANDLYSARAVDVLGTTGRIRGWRLYNQSGNTWVQQ
jgi:prepilin-type N-terminal cleavage/methylation domain-containing protein